MIFSSLFAGGSPVRFSKASAAEWIGVDVFLRQAERDSSHESLHGEAEAKHRRDGTSKRRNRATTSLVTARWRDSQGPT